MGKTSWAGAWVGQDFSVLRLVTGNLQGVGERNDALSCVVAISIIIHSAQLIGGKIKLQGRQNRRSKCEGSEQGK